MKQFYLDAAIEQKVAGQLSKAFKQQADQYTKQAVTLLQLAGIVITGAKISIDVAQKIESDPKLKRVRELSSLSHYFLGYSEHTGNVATGRSVRLYDSIKPNGNFEILDVIVKNAVGQKVSQYHSLELWESLFNAADYITSASEFKYVEQETTKVLEQMKEKLSRRSPDIDFKNTTLTEGTDYVLA